MAAHGHERDRRPKGRFGRLRGSQGRAGNVLASIAGCVVLVLGLKVLDDALSRDRTLGGERNAVRGGLTRTASATHGGVLVLGSSTTADWVDPSYLGEVFDVPASRVTDGHINGCHQPCTLAQVRGLERRGLRFEVVVYGTNLFQLCEHEHSKRVLQDAALTPIEDVPELLWSYRHTARPLRYVARFMGGVISGVYADTSAVQRGWRERWLGRAPVGQETAFLAEPGGRLPEVDRHACDYTDADIAWKRYASEQLFAKLSRLADRVVIVLLPDASLARTDAETQARWARHREVHREWVAPYENVSLVDLSVGGLGAPGDFRDGFHVTPSAAKRQRTQFATLLGATSGEVGP